MNEQFAASTLELDCEPSSASPPDAVHCEQCGKPFSRRTGSGGKPQRYCSPDCRQAFHAQRGQRSPTLDVDCDQATAAEEGPTPTPHQRRSMMVKGLEDFDSRQKTETAGELVDRLVADGQVRLRATESVPYDDFDWFSEDVILREQRGTAIYRNPAGDVVIRQERSWCEDEDPYVVIAAVNLQTFIDRLCDLAGIPSAP